MVPGDTFYPSLFQNSEENGRLPHYATPFPPQDFHGLTLRRSMSISEEMQVEDEMSDHDGGGGALGEKKKRLSSEQVRGLENSYELGSKLDQERKEKISSALGLSQRQVAIWFQNRRARDKTKQMEKDYQMLLKEFEVVKNDNDLLRAENQEFQSQIMALKRQRNLMNRENAASSWSPVDVNLGMTSGGVTAMEGSGMLGFPSGMEQAAAAAAVVAAAPPLQHNHLLQGSMADQANMFNSGGGVVNDQVPEQTAFWGWPENHNFR